MKTCNICNEEKLLEQFYKNGTYWRPECKVCSDIKQAAAKFKLTKEQLLAMYEAQDWKCAICRKVCESYRNLSIDHDHKCCPTSAKSCGKCVRGLLCAACNHGLGNFRDNIDSLRRAIVYLS